MKVINKNAQFEYELGERLEAGIVLTGGEAKSARSGQVSLKEAFVKIVDGEAWLINAHINPYKFAQTEDYEPARSRKLLVSRKELIRIQHRMQEKGMTVVPTAMYTRGPLVKVEVALARGKKQYEKREIIKKKDIQRDVERELR